MLYRCSVYVYSIDLARDLPAVAKLVSLLLTPADPGHRDCLTQLGQEPNHMVQG
jgi:hypothetical protein